MTLSRGRPVALRLHLSMDLPSGNPCMLQVGIKFHVSICNYLLAVNTLENIFSTYLAAETAVVAADAADARAVICLDGEGNRITSWNPHG